jgi:hypothetical protein
MHRVVPCVVACGDSQKPRRRDVFERFLEFKEQWDRGNPNWKAPAAPALEAAWRAGHKERGNL